jgi:molybdopterin-guanine dinucleotide biosynthesis protein A
MAHGPRMILGVVLAGGQSTRFGSDKALAELHGRTLLARAVDALSGWCEYVVVAGRETAPAPCIPDWPGPGMGPLAGIAAGLHHALDEGYETVLTCGVDSAGLPENLLELLSPAPAYLASQPVIGHWRADAASVVEAILQSEGRHSMLAFANATNARGVKFASTPANINTPADLAAIQDAAVEKRDGI